MRTDTPNFAALNVAAAKRPRYAVSVAFDSANVNVWWFTSHSDAATPPGASVISGVIEEISGTSQTLAPDKANASIGDINFRLTDKASQVTSTLGSQIALGRSTRRQRVQVYIGYEGLAWADYSLVQTQLVTDITYDEGSYLFRCMDVQRQMRKDLFVLAKTNLSATIDEAATAIDVPSTSAFSMVAHGTSYTDSPSATVGYIQIEDEIVKYTGKTSTQFTGCTRGALNTRAARHEADLSVTADQRTEVKEYVFLEMPAVKLIYALLTGVLYGQGGAVLPTSWHLGIDTAYVQLADFTSKSDLWNTADDSAGFQVRFENLEKTDGKAFIEKELALLCGAFMPIYASGALGLRRMSNILAGAAYTRELNDTNVTSVGQLLHDFDSLHNNLQIKWNWEFLSQEFTRTTLLLDGSSYTVHGKSDPLDLEFRGLHGSIHSTATLSLRFDALRDRYSGPPLRLPLDLVPSMNTLEIGDVVRVRLPKVRDFVANGSLDRSFEVQGIAMNWVTGAMSVDLFASSQAPGAMPATTDSSVLTAGWFTSAGTNLATVLTITGSNPGHVSADGTVNGNVDMNAAGAIFYYNGDLQIDSGKTVTLTGNVQIRVKGTLTNNGTISGKGGGIAGAAQIAGAPASATDSNAGTSGFIGSTEAGGGVSATKIQTGFSGSSLFFVIFNSARGRTVAGANVAVPSLNLSWNGTTLAGLPTDMRGSSGSSGGPLFDGGAGIGSAKGGAGGASGAGLAIISRGFSQGVAGKVDLSGGDGSLGGFVDFAGGGYPHTNRYFAGSGAGGAPGGLAIILDGAATTATGLSETGFLALNGKTPLEPGPVPETPHYIDFQGSFYSSMYIGTGDGTTFPLPTLSGARGASRVQYVPGNPTPVADEGAALTPPSELQGLLSGGTLTAIWNPTTDLMVAGYDLQYKLSASSTWPSSPSVSVTPRTAASATLAAGLGAGPYDVRIRSAGSLRQIGDWTNQQRLVQTRDITDQAVTTIKIIDSGVTTVKINDSAVTTIKITDANVTTAKIADANVTGPKIAPGAVSTTTLADGSVTTVKLGDSSVTTVKTADGAITTAKIGALQVTTAVMADGSVTTPKLVDANVTTAKLVDLGVTTAKLNDLAVTTAKLQDLGVTTGKLVDASVVAAKVAANALDLSKLTLNLNAALQFGDARNVLFNPAFENGQAYWQATRSGSGGTVITNSANAKSGNKYMELTAAGGSESSQWQTDDAGNVRYFEVNPGDVIKWGAQINITVAGAGGAIIYVETFDKDLAHVAYTGISGGIGWSAVSTELTIPAGTKYAVIFPYAYNGCTARFDEVFLIRETPGGDIVARTITADRIQTAALTANEIASHTLTAAVIAAGTITATEIAASTITGGKIAAGTITAGNIAADTITANEIAANAVTVSELAANAVTAVKISAGAVTTDKLLVASYGAALSTDPGMLDSTAWTNNWGGSASSLATITDGKVGTGVLRSPAGQSSAGNPASDRYYIPLDPAKTYRIRGWARRLSGSGGAFYLGISSWSDAGSNLNNFYQAASNLTNISTSWTEYVGSIDGATIIAANAANRRLLPIILMNWGSGNEVIELQDVRIEEVLPGTLIQDGAIITAKLAAGAVTAAKITAGTITTNEIAANTIVAGNIAASTITGAKIASATITSGLISVSQLSAISADIGAATAGSITLTTGTAHIKMGSATDYMTGTGMFAGMISGTFKSHWGNPSGNNIHWDGSTLSVDAVLTSAEVVLTGTNAGGSAVLRTDTADGSDSKYLSLSGGGGVGVTRGSWIQLNGNETASDHGGALWLVGGNGDGTATAGNIIFAVSPSGTAVTAGIITRDGNWLIGNSNSTTSRVGDLLYAPGSAGIPTGAPAAQGSRIPMVYDSTNDKLFFYNSSWKRASPITELTEQATTSGTTKDFTIPAGARMVVMQLRQVSTNGTSTLLVQLGDAGGIETTGYSDVSLASGGAGTAPTNGFALTVNAVASSKYSGNIVLTRANAGNNTWVQSANISAIDIGGGTAQQFYVSAGEKSTSQELSTVRLTSVTPDTFDLGNVNVQVYF